MASLFLILCMGYLWLLSSFFMFRLFWFSRWERLRAGFCVLLPCPQPTLSTSLLKAHLPQPWNWPFLQGASASAQVVSSLWLGSNTSFWVSGPRSPIEYPPFSTQALTVPAGLSSSLLGVYLRLHHTDAPDSAPTLTLRIGHWSRPWAPCPTVGPAAGYLPAVDMYFAMSCLMALGLNCWGRRGANIWVQNGR